MIVFKKPLAQIKIFYIVFFSVLSIVLLSAWIFIDPIEIIIFVNLNSFLISFIIDAKMHHRLYYRKIKHKGVKNYTTYIIKNYTISFLDGTNKMHNEKTAAAKYRNKINTLFYSYTFFDYWIDGEHMGVSTSTIKDGRDKFNKKIKLFTLSNKIEDFL
jgi:hypothetical protein